ncbi:MAG: hypothetical protein ABR992_13895 [Solirubrobacteraceae bacterium]|jgi:hypothetical protein
MRPIHRVDAGQRLVRIHWPSLLPRRPGRNRPNRTDAPGGSDTGHALYSQRKQAIEPIFGQIKHNLCIQRFTTEASRLQIGVATHRHHHTSSSHQTSPLTAKAVVASVVGILHARLSTGQAPPFLDMLGSLAALIIAPHVDGQPRVE